MVVINWLKGNFTVDRGTFKPGSELELRSVYHKDTPEAYEVYEVLPKILWFARKDRRIATLPAKPLEPLQGRYHTANLWRLPAPANKKNGLLTFVAKVGDVYSGTITSSSMQIATNTRRTKSEDSLKGALEAKFPGGKGSVEAGHKSSDEGEITVQVAPTLDPEVAIRLLQGDEVGTHILELINDWFEEDSAESRYIESHVVNALGSYLKGPRIEFDYIKTKLVPPEKASFTIPITLSANLKTVVCLQVDDLDHDTTTISEPRFITAAGGRIVMSDLVPALFDERTQQLVQEFTEQLQGGRKQPDPELSAQLIDVVGTNDVGDLAALLGLSYAEPTEEAGGSSGHH